MKEACLYEKLKDGNVRCRACAHYCVISPGKRGICGVRENRDGALYSLVYAKAAACNIDPIEKKPLFHFLPGTRSLSIATVGCNFRCLNCQNWDISQAPKPQNPVTGNDLPPEEAVKIALAEKLPSISYTYTEPTVFVEYALDTMKLARAAGLKNVWVSNGYMSEENFGLVSPYLDAANVDLKGFSEEFYLKNCGAKLQPVLDTLIRMKKNKIWLEVTTLVIPAFSADEKTFKGIAKFIKEKLGAETPWHVSRFSGLISWQLRGVPETPVETLEAAYRIGKKAGLKHVYVGNVPGLRFEDTRCPKCQTVNIDRTGYRITRFDKDGKCFECGEDLNIINA